MDSREINTGENTIPERDRERDLIAAHLRTMARAANDLVEIGLVSGMDANTLSILAQQAAARFLFDAATLIEGNAHRKGTAAHD